MHYEPIFSSLLLSKILLMVFTLALALIASIALRFWGFQHPEPLEASMSVILILLVAPVLFVGILAYFLGFRSIDA
tara:strand:- start:78 stop:305 length:228 start_codon:yes stop_codon:yes gene_type:complete